MRRNDHSSYNPGIDIDNGMAEIRTAVEYILSVFRVPLEAKGACRVSIRDELEEAVSYARGYLPIPTANYRKVWFQLHTCRDSNKWPNMLMLSELTFSLPVSTSRVEQILSLLKVIKTKRRTSLHTSTVNDLLRYVLKGLFSPRSTQMQQLIYGGRNAGPVVG